jgi:transposase
MAFEGDVAIDPIRLSPSQRHRLEQWVRAGMTPQRLVRRSRIVLLASDGWSNSRIARALAVSVPTVALWRRRFVEGGIECLRHDAPGRGRKRRISAESIAAILRGLTDSAPGGGRWTVRKMAQVAGISPASIWRLCRTNNVDVARRPRHPQVNS